MPVVIVSALDWVLRAGDAIVAVTRTAVCSVPELTTVCTVPSAADTADVGDRLMPPALVFRVKLTVAPGRAAPVESTTLKMTVEVSGNPVPLRPSEGGCGRFELDRADRSGRDGHRAARRKSRADDGRRRGDHVRAAAALRRVGRIDGTRRAGDRACGGSSRAGPRGRDDGLAVAETGGAVRDDDWGHRIEDAALVDDAERKARRAAGGDVGARQADHARLKARAATVAQLIGIRGSSAGTRSCARTGARTTAGARRAQVRPRRSRRAASMPRPT